MLKLSWRVHRWLFRVSGGRIGPRVNGFAILLLTDRHPDWWRNLEATPEADVQVGTAHVGVRAREALGEERAELWDRFVAIDHAYADYDRHTTRVIPVVVLERR